MIAHRRARSPRAAARVALCVVALLAVASVASAVSPSETDKRSAHESHHARKARLREEVAAAELTTREKYEAKVLILEKTTERLRREAEETVASLSAERDALSRNLTKYKRGLLNLDAKRKSETETLHAETERLRAEREELQSKLEQALDDALRATKAAADAKRESRAIARAVKAEGGTAETKRNIDEILTSASSSSSSSAVVGLVSGVAEIVSGALARAARLAARKGRAMRPRNALRVVAAAARDRGWLPVAASASDDDAAACLAAVVVAAALGALAAKGRVAAERLARVVASAVAANASEGNARLRFSRVGAGWRDGRNRSPAAFPTAARAAKARGGSEPPRDSDSDEYELVDDDASTQSNRSLPGSPTRAAADAARSFDAAPEAFERSLSSPESEEEAQGEVGVSARVAALEESAARGEVSRPEADSPGREPDAGADPFASFLRTSDPGIGPLPGLFETPGSDRAAGGPTGSETKPGTGGSSAGRAASSPAIRDGALKSALRRLAEALATPKAAPGTARASAETPAASRRAEKPETANDARDDYEEDDEDDATRTAGTRRVAVETKKPFSEPSEISGSRRRLSPSPGSIRGGSAAAVPATKKTPANVTSAPLVRTPAPPLVGGRTPGSGDSASSADRGGGASSLSPLGLSRMPSPAGARPPVTPRDRMVAYSQKLRRGVNVAIPALDAPTPPWGGDAIAAGGVRHPKGWAS